MDTFRSSYIHVGAARRATEGAIVPLCSSCRVGEGSFPVSSEIWQIKHNRIDLFINLQEALFAQQAWQYKQKCTVHVFMYIRRN